MRTGVNRWLAAAAVAAMTTGGAGLLVERAMAATATANLAVSASVARNCTISANPLAFGAYDPVVANASTDLDQNTTLVVACTKGTNATVSLDNGGNFSGGTRRMTDGSDFLDYNLYLDAPRTTVWNATNTYAYVAASKAATPLTVYGRVTANQDVAEGNYADTVVATIEF